MRDTVLADLAAASDYHAEYAPIDVSVSDNNRQTNDGSDDAWDADAIDWGDPF